MSKEAMKLAQAVIDAARAAMDSSFEAGNEQMDISIPAHLAAALSLCLDECDREALAEQPAQQEEPVARVNDDGFIVETGLLISPGQLLYTSPPAQRKPLPYNKDDMEGLDINQRLGFKLGWKSAEEAHGIKENK